MTDTETMLAPDYSLLRDPAEIWPEPEDCPVYPTNAGGEVHGRGRYDKDEAEARLSYLIGLLGSSEGPFRAPTDAEKRAFMSRHFVIPEPGTNSGKMQRLARLGFGGLQTASGDLGRKAMAAVEAVHLRGYLRKLEAEAQQNEALTDDREKRKLKAVVTGFTAILGNHVAELNALAASEERHLQAKADALAHARCVELRRTLKIRYAAAEVAASELGQTIPDLPEMRADEGL